MAEVRRLRLGGAEAPGAAREFVAGVAEHTYHDEAFAETLRLVVSEVVTNSVRHGQGGGDGCVELTVEAAPHRLRLEIADEGMGFEPTPTPGRPDRPGGWGLYLVDTLVDRWGVEASPGTRVWLEMSPSSGGSLGPTASREAAIRKAESVSVASSSLRTGEEGRTRIIRPPRARSDPTPTGSRGLALAHPPAPQHLDLSSGPTRRDVVCLGV